MKKIRIEQSILKETLTKLSKFMSKDDTRYYLCGIYFYFENGEFIAVANNGHILCEIKIEHEVIDGIEDWNLILPAQAVKNILKILPKVKKDEASGVSIEKDGNRLIFDFLDFKYNTNLIDGIFPDYKQLMPMDIVGDKTYFNAQYIQAALLALNDQPINIGSSEKEAAHLLTSDKLPNVKCVLMPMRV